MFWISIESTGNQLTVNQISSVSDQRFVRPHPVGFVWVYKRDEAEVCLKRVTMALCPFSNTISLRVQPFWGHLSNMRALFRHSLHQHFTKLKVWPHSCLCPKALYKWTVLRDWNNVFASPKHRFIFPYKGLRGLA